MKWLIPHLFILDRTFFSTFSFLFLAQYCHKFIYLFSFVQESTFGFLTFSSLCLLKMFTPSLHWSRASFPGPSSSFLPQGLCTSVPSAWRALPGPSPGCYFFLSSPLFGEASLSSTTPTIRATLLSSSKQLSPLEVFLAVYFLHPSPNQNRS